MKTDGMASGGIQNNLNFSGRRVLVTGGGRGIGRVAVGQFFQLGAQVIVFDRDNDLLAKLKVDYPTVTTVKVDLSNWTETKAAAQSVLPIHHLVNNAGIVGPTEFFKVDPSTLEKFFSVNFNAVINLSQVVATGMIQNGIKDGTIVNITSESDKRCFKTRPLTVYSCTKSAVTQLTRIMAVELSDQGIRVNAVRPSVVNTEMLNILSKEDQQKMLESFKGRMAIPRFVEPDEIARAIVFLSSSASTMMTGTVLTVDGGKDLF